MNPATILGADWGKLPKKRAVYIADVGDLEIPCPIDGCDKVFYGSRGGWDSHVASFRRHPDWHPEISDGKERKRVFREEFPDWFTS